MSTKPRAGPDAANNHQDAQEGIQQIVTDSTSSMDELATDPIGAGADQSKPNGKRVGFTSTPSSAEDKSGSATLHLQPRPYPPYAALPSNTASSATSSRDERLSPTPTHQGTTPAPEELVKAVHKAFGQPMSSAKPKPAIRKAPSTELEAFSSKAEPDDGDTPAARSRDKAFNRAKRLARSVCSASAPSSRRNSFDDELEIRHSRSKTFATIPKITTTNVSDYVNTVSPLGDLPSEDEAESPEKTKQEPARDTTLTKAKKLVRSHTRHGPQRTTLHTEPIPLISRPSTPPMEQAFDDYVAPPPKYHGGIFGALLNLYGAQGDALPSHSRTNSNNTLGSSLTTPAITPQHSPPTSGANTPASHGQKKQWYTRGNHHAQHSQTSLAQLIGPSSMLATPGMSSDRPNELLEQLKRTPRPSMGKRTRSGDAISTAMQRLAKPRLEDQIRITIHISEIIARQRYLMKLCRALMMYGAPTHRLEDCLKMSARVLGVESQFLYIPGTMIISFDDSTTHTAEIRVIRESQGVDLGKMRDTHVIYKDVVHDRIGVEEATKELDHIITRPQKFKPWFLVLMYGVASATVGPFAFQARLIDLPISFLLGCLVGFLQQIAAPSSTLFNNVLEISAAILTSFLARAFGSINGGELFCFSALAQSSIALILPGYAVLCASSELQSKNLVAGSVRMVYAIIYSLFLGFGMTIGIVLFGAMDATATSSHQCSNEMPTEWSFFFVPAFTISLCIINQAKWAQQPAMVVISFVGYAVNKFSSERFQGNTQISSTLGALAIGTLANLYSRLGTKADNYFLDLYETHLRPRYRALRRKLTGKTEELRMSLKAMEEARPSPPTSSDSSEIYVPRTRKVGYGVAAAAMLPAIFVQVPSGLAVSGSLISGITSANQILHDVNGTTTTLQADGTVNSAAFSVGYSVIQVAIGITVGLFLSALFVYPFGKRRSGLFSF